MSLITKETDYAARALLFLAKQKGRVVSSSELDKELGVPRPILRKVLQRLQREGILISQKGNRGGFTLVKEPKDIFLMDLMKIFQGNFSFLNCFVRDKLCANVKTCSIRKHVYKIEQKVVRELKTLTIQKLMREN
ncbi:MAG: Rrf2 family transcriptional regulator [Candidatus Aceula meridiana]|nr:Rrf2 family transcriptional regulator [Candidatus Aceula meridiana]